MQGGARCSRTDPFFLVQWGLPRGECSMEQVRKSWWRQWVPISTKQVQVTITSQILSVIKFMSLERKPTQTGAFRVVLTFPGSQRGMWTSRVEALLLWPAIAQNPTTRATATTSIPWAKIRGSRCQVALPSFKNKFPSSIRKRSQGPTIIWTKWHSALEKNPTSWALKRAA